MAATTLLRFLTGPSPVCIFAAQLALLAPTSLARLFHAGLHVFLPSTLKAFCSIETLTWVGLGLCLLAHFGRCRGMPVLVAAFIDVLAILHTKLALLATAATAFAFHTGLGIFLPNTCQSGCSIHASAWIFRGGCLPHKRESNAFHQEHCHFGEQNFASAELYLKRLDGKRAKPS